MFLGLVGAALFNQSVKVQATGSAHHLEWGSWSSCVPDAQCGTTHGTKTRSCYQVNGYGYNDCSYVGQKDTDGCTVQYHACPTHGVCRDNACVQVQGAGDSSCKVNDDCIVVTPTPPVTPAPVCTENCGNPPTFAGSSTLPPVCGDKSTTQLPANVHVIRKGSEATVNFFITEGNSANIYYGIVGQPHWQYAVADVKPNADNFVSFTIQALNPALGYEFGVQQKQGCGGGQLVTAVVIDGPVSRVFGFSYWEWSK